MNLWKISKYSIIIFVTGFSLSYIWLAYIFFPDDYDIAQKEAARPVKLRQSQVVGVSLMDFIDNAQISGNYSTEKIFKIINKLKEKNFLIKDDPFIESPRRNLCFRVGTGYPGIWVDERSSLIVPNDSKITFYLTLKQLPELEFSASSFLSDGIIIVEVSSYRHKKIKKRINIKKYKQKYSIKDAGVTWNNIGFDKANDDSGWKDLSIDLSKFQRKKVKLCISYKSKDGALFIANPKIFKRSGQRRYNIIYLVFDGVSTRHFSFYNDQSNLTPFMKDVADKDFIVFNNMFSLGNKKRISTAGLFSSVLPYNTGHGVNRNFIPEVEKENYYRSVRTGNLASLPDVYRKRGYITQQFGNSACTVHLLSTGVDYGFERSYEFSFNPYDSYGISHNFFKFLRKNNNREFFAYLHYNTPGHPLYAPLKYYFKGLSRAPFKTLLRPDFMGCISYMDDVFKNIYLALKTNNLLENTIIVMATDNGSGYEEFKFDKELLYNDYSRMTFMMSLPERLKKQYQIKSNRIDTYLSSINIAPTLIELTDMNKINAFDGKSFVNILNNKYSRKLFDNRIWCFGGNSISFITSDMYKYVLSYSDTKMFKDWMKIISGKQLKSPFEELYNLDIDKNETFNIANKEKFLLEKFRKIYVDKDIHQSETTVIAFLPYDNKNRKIEINIKNTSKFTDISLLSKTLEKSNSMKVFRKRTKAMIFFMIKNKPLYLVFKNENDRSPMSIHIKSNGKSLNKKNIYSSSENLNIKSNPLALKEKKDFLLLNDIKLAQKRDFLNQKDGLIVKISRIDLSIWIDINNLEETEILAGMKAVYDPTN